MEIIMENYKNYRKVFLDIEILKKSL